MRGSGWGGTRKRSVLNKEVKALGVGEEDGGRGGEGLVLRLKHWRGKISLNIFF